VHKKFEFNGERSGKLLKKSLSQRYEYLKYVPSPILWLTPGRSQVGCPDLAHPGIELIEDVQRFHIVSFLFPQFLHRLPESPECQ